MLAAASRPPTTHAMAFIDQLSWYVPILSIAFVLFLTSINVYIRIRRRFSVAVNCWFCARDARVAYDVANSWHCPHCAQYNGFGPDGDYNREIPAQRVTNMNCAQFAVRRHSPNGQQHGPARDYGRNYIDLTTSLDSNSSVAASTVFRSHNSSSSNGNGLCGPCNLNQELKVQQLAVFEPQSDRTYDAEIAAYQQQLEQAYRLCVRCERHVRRRLTRVKRTVLGSKLAQIGAHGVHAFDMHMHGAARGQHAAVLKRGRVTSLCVCVLVVLAVCASLRTAAEVRLTRTALRETLPTAAHWLFVAVALARTMWLGARAAGSMVWLAIGADRLWDGGCRLLAMSSTFVQQFNGWWEQHADIVSAATSATPVPVAGMVEEKVVCIAALMVCLLLAWLRECRRVWLAAVLLLWSLKCVQPTLWTDADAPVWFDLARICADVGIAGATLRLVFTHRGLGSRTASSTAHKNRSNNNSFHRIYTEADIGELSDDYDEYNSTDNTTIRSASSVLSTSTQSPPSNDFRYRTPSIKHRPKNSSADSTLSLGMSAFTPNTLRRTDTMLTSSIRSLNISYDTGEPEAPASQQPPPASAIDGESNRFHSLQSLHSDEQDNDFPCNITQLNISGRYPAKLNQTTAASANANRLPASVVSRYGSYDQMRHRGGASSIIGPARLQTNKQPAAHDSIANGGCGKPMRGSSWIAGGFWGGSSNTNSLVGTSPSKRNNGINNYMNNSITNQSTSRPMAVQQQQQPPVAGPLLPPLMSRTSSQSSGFESRDNGSRESSVGPQAAASISPSDSVSQLAAEPPYQPSYSYRHFGTQRRVDATAAAAAAVAPQRSASAMDSKWAAGATSSSAASPIYEPGSLLRSWQLRTSQADISAHRM